MVSSRVSTHARAVYVFAHLQSVASLLCLGMSPALIALVLTLLCLQVNCSTPVVCWHGINDNAARWAFVSWPPHNDTDAAAPGPWRGWRRRPPGPTPWPSWLGMIWITTPPTVSSWARTTRCYKSLLDIKLGGAWCEWIFGVFEWVQKRRSSMQQ